MSKINFSTVFNRKNKLDKSGEALIHIRANQNGKSIYFSTNISILPIYWNDTKKELRNTHPQYITLNRQINELKEKLINLSAKIFDRKKYVTLELITEYYNNQTKVNNSFLDFYESELKTINQSWKTTSMEQTTLKELKDFKKQIFFDDLNFELLTDFVTLLEKRGKHQNTVYKYIKHIKKYVNIAIRKDLLDANKNPFIKFSYKQIEGQREYLRTDEFFKLLNFTLPENKKHLQNVFDIFLFGCFSGLRISDLMELSKTDLKQSIKDGYYIERKMIKTKFNVYIPLDNLYKALNLEIPKENTPTEILKRNIALQNENGLIFTPFNLQHTYRKLHEIFDLIGLEYVGFHAARHTIAMYLINEIGLDITSISKLLGHRDLRTTKIYSRMSNEGLNNQLKVIYNRTNQTETKTKAM